MATTVVPPSVSAGAPGTSSTSMIMADLGIGSTPTSETTPSAPASSPAAGAAAPAVGQETADEINAIPEEEAAPEVEETPAVEEAPVVEAAEAVDDDARPEIENLSESRWKTVHSGYRWAREIGKALGVVGEDGRVDVNLLPSVDEVQAMRGAYSDRLAMEHDFSSGDPQNAAAWIENWNTFSPQGMTTVAKALPAILAQSNPSGYNAMAEPVLTRALDFMYMRGAEEQDPDLRQYILNSARGMEWWLKGGPNGGTYRPDAEIKIGNGTQPNQLEQRLAASEARLRQIQEQGATAQWGGFVQAVNSKIGESVNTEVDTALKPLKAFYPNEVSYRAVRNEFVNRFQQALKADGVSKRQFDIAVERAKQTQSADDQAQLVGMYNAMVKRAMHAVRGKFVTEASQGIKENSDARHQQLAASAAKKGPASGGAPRAQSIMPKLDRQQNETNAEYQQRMINRDLGI